MNEDVITDLKQFITTTMSQQLALQSEEFDRKLTSLENKLSTKIDNLGAAIADAIDDLNERTDKRFSSHNKRITRLERKAA